MAEDIAAFLEQTTLPPNSKIRRKSLYRQYTEYCLANKISRLSKGKFTDHFTVEKDVVKGKTYLTVNRTDKRKERERLIVPLRDESRTPSPIAFMHNREHRILLSPLILIDRSEMPIDSHTYAYRSSSRTDYLERYAAWNASEDRRLAQLAEDLKVLTANEQERIDELRGILRNEYTSILYSLQKTHSATDSDTSSGSNDFPNQPVDTRGTPGIPLITVNVLGVETEYAADTITLIPDPPSDSHDTASDETETDEAHEEYLPRRNRNPFSDLLDELENIGQYPMLQGNLPVERESPPSQHVALQDLIELLERETEKIN